LCTHSAARTSAYNNALRSLHSFSSQFSVLLQRQGINFGVGDMHQSHNIVSGFGSAAAAHVQCTMPLRGNKLC